MVWSRQQISAAIDELDTGGRFPTCSIPGHLLACSNSYSILTCCRQREKSVATENLHHISYNITECTVRGTVGVLAERDRAFPNLGAAFRLCVTLCSIRSGLTNNGEPKCRVELESTGQVRKSGDGNGRMMEREARLEPA